ncbi:hypothetical protein [Deinococcus apachensis]|uniref:hypothetical protein n=1 Tax=Deinococcus apachensis TaxID=309886 RepID=UPI000374A5BF|nr:hypothetical protein [Deinococcus apachensis]
MPTKLSLLSPRNPGSATGTLPGGEVRLPLTPTPGGNASMALQGGTLYVRPSGAGAPLTACDHDRAAALGYLFEGEPAVWPFTEEQPPVRGTGRTGTPTREAALLLDLPALLPAYSWAAQAGPPGTPLIVSASGAGGTVTVSITSATYERHRSAATLSYEIASTVRRAVAGLPALSCTI